jgi:hypothetical protein
LLLGFEPKGGDPERIFRPINLVRSEAFRRGEIPWWSDQFGLGVPLVAESHAAAFYPPNHVLDRLLDVRVAYRLSMWLHEVLLAFGLFLYARNRGISIAGASLASITFPLCGWMSIQSSHSWSYQALAWTPWILLAVERYIESGRLQYLTAIALGWGAQLLIGHFQMQFYTGLLAASLGLWRAIEHKHPVRVLGVLVALALGLGTAAIQLGPTYELAREVNQLKRPVADLMYYALPPAHLAELAAPAIVRIIPEGPEGPYWFFQRSTGYEVCMYIGLIPFVLVLYASLSQSRSNTGMRFWTSVVIVALVIASMPHWWPQGFAAVLSLPGFGLFRCPARYAALASFGLALLAGQGLDAYQTTRPRAFLLIAILALAITALAFAWSMITFARVRPMEEDRTWALAVGLTICGWIMALGFLVFARRSPRLGIPTLLAATAVELSFAFLHSTTEWGSAIDVASNSALLEALRNEPEAGRFQGELDNLPVWVGRVPARPYFGFPMPGPTRNLPDYPIQTADRSYHHLFKRFGFTHSILRYHDRQFVNFDSLHRTNPGFVQLFEAEDPVLDQVAKRDWPRPRESPALWSLIRWNQPEPPAHLVRRFEVYPSRASLLADLSRDPTRDVVRFLAPLAPGANIPRMGLDPEARIDSLEDRTAVVEHNGPTILVWNRAYFPGWVARVESKEGSHETGIVPCDGGIQAILLAGIGPSRIRLEYSPTHLQFWAAVSLSSLVLSLSLGAVFVWRQLHAPRPPSDAFH